MFCFGLVCLFLSFCFVFSLCVGRGVCVCVCVCVCLVLFCLYLFVFVLFSSLLFCFVLFCFAIFEGEFWQACLYYNRISRVNHTSNYRPSESTSLLIELLCTFLHPWSTKLTRSTRMSSADDNRKFSNFFVKNFKIQIFIAIFLDSACIQISTIKPSIG